MIISASYLPPVKYFQKISGLSEIKIDLHEHFVKQTIRNRCHILSPNGVHTLIVPIVHRNRTNTPLNEILIANDQQWQRQHWLTLESCYRRSAYFEFYMDEFEPFYRKEFSFLHEFNLGLTQLLFNLLKLKTKINFTENYIPPVKEDENDLRIWCNSGTPSNDPFQKKYPQVFGYKSGFTTGLSIVDMLFNCGADSIRYL